MAKQGYKFVMTSSLSDEQGQFFYRNLGYTDRGALVLPDEPLEIIFYKNINENILPPPCLASARQVEV